MSKRPIEENLGGIVNIASNFELTFLKKDKKVSIRRDDEHIFLIKVGSGLLEYLMYYYIIRLIFIQYVSTYLQDDMLKMDFLVQQINSFGPWFSIYKYLNFYSVMSVEIITPIQLGY